MDNCDLEKLAFSDGKLQPAFKANVTKYNVTVASDVSQVTLDLLTSDSGASYKVLFGDGSKNIKLNDGLNKVDIEVVAEDGTSKKYFVEITKLSARTAVLSGLAIEGDIKLHPEFSANIYEYSSTVAFHCNYVTVLPKLPDKNMKVSVNGEANPVPVPLNVGDTVVEVTVCSADGSNSQMYILVVTRELIPMAMSFRNGKDQLDYECPISLTALYRPVSIHQSEPQHFFSGPYIDMLARRSKIDPLNERPLGDNWKVAEPDLDKTISIALVKCFFAYRECQSVVKMAEVGSHALECPHKPSAELDAKDVNETGWYKKHFASSSSLEIETKHTLEVRNWEKRLQKAIGEDNIENLCALAQDHMKQYRERLPKPGDILTYEEGHSPLDSLEQVAVHYASAIKLKSKDPRLHFLLGLALEEQYYATEMYGLKKKADGDSEDQKGAKATALIDDILAVCKLHGFQGKPTRENQLQALDTEYHQLLDQGQSGKADYIQTLYLWLSKKGGKDGSAAVGDEESSVYRALLKYLDAWSLSHDHWEYNLHAGRLLLLQRRPKEALQHLQTGLAMRPLQPALRFYTGLALLQEEKNPSGATEKEAALFLQQGLEHLLAKQCSNSVPVERDVSNPLCSMSSQFLRGCLTLGELQQKNTLSQKAMGAEQVYHTIAVLAAQGVCRCVCRGAVVQQLEWVLLDAHFALLLRLQGQGQVQGKAATERQAWVARRCQALSGLARLTSIAPCSELMDMQEKVCQVAVVTSPRDSHALCLLGQAQLAQCENDPESERSKVISADACLSFQASIALESELQCGLVPEQLTKQKWWQDRLQAEAQKKAANQPADGKGPSNAAAVGRGSGRGKEVPVRAAPAKAPAPVKGGKAAPPAKPPAGKGRGGAAPAPDTADKPPGKPNSKTQLSPSKSQPDCPAKETSQALAVADSGSGVNHKSHVPRLGLARALSRSKDTHDQAQHLYEEVISMAPEVHDAYIELAQLLVPTDPQAAVEVYCRFPLKPVAEQTFDDAFITGEIIRILMKLELYEHPQLEPKLIAYGKVMGLGCLEKYISILDAKFKNKLLKNLYAGVHNKSVNDKDLQDFFKFKCWI